MNENRKGLSISIIVLFVGVSIIPLTSSSFYQMDNDIIGCDSLNDITIVSIQPSAQTVEKGELFTVNIYVEPSEIIIGIGFDIYFDPTLIQADSVFPSWDLFEWVCTFPPTPGFDYGTIDNINGRITGIMGIPIPVYPTEDPGIFCYIEFITQQELGTSFLDIQNVTILDIDFNPLPSTVIDGEVTVEGPNNPPYEPSNPNPPDGATNVSCPILSWTGGDPDPDDIVSYVFIFGDTNPPDTVYYNGSDTSILLSEPLDYDTTYYWQIVAWDNHGASTHGPIWSFTTKSKPKPRFPYLELNGTMGENDWYISCVTITFIDIYPHVDCITYFKLNDGEWQVYDEPFIVCEDGKYRLEYYSKDNGILEKINEVEFKIDQTEPTIELTAEKIGCNMWLFIADVFDETSGINRVEFYVDGEFVGEVIEAPFEWKWSGTNDHTVQAVVYDNAGNSAESEVVDNGPVIKIESSPFPLMLPGLEAYVTNTGNADSTDVEWSFKWYGGWILGERLSDKMRDTSGEIPVLSPGEGADISSIKFGCGRVTITIYAECAEGSFDEVVIEAKMMGFFLKILGEGEK